MDIDVKNLHPLEVKVLRHVALGEDITAERLIRELDYKVGQCNQAFSWLCAKECLVEKSRDKYVLYELTETGNEQCKNGLPVERIFNFLKDNGPSALPEIAAALSLEQSDVGSSFGQLTKAKAAGLTSLNLSLDALDPALYARMTRGGDVSRVLAALDEALALGLPVKLNCVPVRGLNEGELKPLAALAKDKAIDVRFIELMPLGCGRDLQPVPPEKVLSRLEAAFGASVPDTGAHGHGPAVYRRFPGFSGAVGFIGALSACFCETCNRVRLTSDGRLKLCLNHTAGLDLRALLRAGASDDEILRKIARAIELKPARHEFFKENRDAESRRMNEIGG